MKKKQTIFVILLILGLILVLNFVSWATPNVINESPSNQFSSSILSNLIPLFTGVIIVGMAAIWIFVVMKH